MQIILANPRGFCAGVDRAISIVKRALEIYGSPVYVCHEVVHNHYVNNRLRKLGAIFIEKISEVPDNKILIFSAHGVSQAVRTEAKMRNLTMLLDATCPLVTKVHMQVMRASRKGIEVILIGHSGHPEVEGTMGQYSNPIGGIYLIESPEDVYKLQVKNNSNLCFVTQTTLSMDYTLDIIHALKDRFPKIIGPRKNNICYATINRQEAVRKLANKVELLIVVGSQNSSNSNRLTEIAQGMGIPSFLINYASDICKNWIHNIQCIGVTAGASAPEILVQDVIKRLQKFGGECPVEMQGHEENIFFNISKELLINIKDID
ncbi:4-hydroxy-3-methylbut-2-enyl diphosphate reductase [Candidatus Profftia lariciata]|uniref:4-hydroxy-3-methylbut-2-enyl diphosphate reductase n=1 Tax=Candidatus Profftia lariciata TaxID=1987921 RepID=UPI001D00D356|nr:4-hydroxy-3-methylbut-2-enyl diphosphate reductase [Candidatus Profftia lariciata]UDG81760.1 4-hydroxy-3-methylbut-2-enyl diphosphate reductase [Candidatus Profftia lariciata]